MYSSLPTCYSFFLDPSTPISNKLTKTDLAYRLKCISLVLLLRDLFRILLESTDEAFACVLSI